MNADEIEAMLKRAKKGDVLLLRGKTGRYSYQGTSKTQAGRTVVSLVGPIDSAAKQYCACYLEDVAGVSTIAPAPGQQRQ
jgi:hypothetical protein